MRHRYVTGVQTCALAISHSSTTFHVSFTDVNPTVTAASAAVSAPEDMAATNSGTYGDFDDAVSRSEERRVGKGGGTRYWPGKGKEEHPYKETGTATNAER